MAEMNITPINPADLEAQYVAREARIAQSFDALSDFVITAKPDQLEKLLDRLEGANKINQRERGMIAKGWQFMHNDISDEEMDAWMGHYDALAADNPTVREMRFAGWLDGIAEASYSTH